MNVDVDGMTTTKTLDQEADHGGIMDLTMKTVDQTHGMVPSNHHRLIK